MAAKFVIDKDASGQFRFRLTSQGRVLATSESYSTKRAARNAIASLQAGAVSAAIEDTTETRSSGRTAAKSNAVAKRIDTVVKARRRRAPSTPAALVAPTEPQSAKRGRRASTAKSGAASTTAAPTAPAAPAARVRKAGRPAKKR